MDKVSNITSCLYGVVLIAGGIIGYIQAHSRMSLVAGVFAGVLILLAAKVGSSNPKAGYLFVASISLVLAIFFSLRFAATHLFIPSGLMLILSTTTYVVVALGWLKCK